MPSSHAPRILLLLTLLTAHGCGTLDAQQERQAPAQEESQNQDAQRGPLAGTGIEPNVVRYPQTETEYSDPLIHFNRAVFAFNDVSYRYVLIPAARIYERAPDPLRSGIANFFNNIKSPILIVNHLLQGKPEAAGVDLMRFAINSTVGIAGFMDPASNRFELERQQTSLSDTLIQYGTGYGTYLVLPLIGPSNLRDGPAFFADGLLNPLLYLLDNPESLVIRGFDNFQEFSSSAEAYLTVRAESEDPYLFMRNLHLQGILRDAEHQ